MTILLLVTVGAGPVAASVIDYVASAEGHGSGVLDVRPEAVCRRGSLPGARCLPVGEFIGPHKRLVNISGMLWLLGSAGLTGDEHLLVIGDHSEEKELMAGLLYLGGQKRISVLQPALDEISAPAKLHPGMVRSKTRETVYAAPMRDERIILRSELRRIVDSPEAPPLMDGRSEEEYWGARVRGLRGGHLPGAQLFPAEVVQDGARKDEIQPFDQTNPWIVYGHDTAEGLVYLARLVALGIEPRLYLEGWVGWASDGALPVDSLTYRDAPVQGRREAEGGEERFPWIPVLGISLAGTLLAVSGFYIGRKTAAG